MKKKTVFKLTILSGILLLCSQGSAQQQTILAPSIKAEVATLKSVAPSINPRVLSLALAAYNKARAKGLDTRQILTVIDYSLPDTENRMWIFDVKHDRLLFHTLVAHGRNSGDVVPTKFSNIPNAKETSLGLYETGNTYFGKDGYSLRLNGLSKGFNDMAYSRAVVMHGAWYVSQSFINATHRLGRSWGCPAVAKTLAKPIINTVKDGTLIFAYANNWNWLHHDAFVSV